MGPEEWESVVDTHAASYPTHMRDTVSLRRSVIETQVSISVQHADPDGSRDERNDTKPSSVKTRNDAKATRCSNK